MRRPEYLHLRRRDQPPALNYSCAAHSLTTTNAPGADARQRAPRAVNDGSHGYVNDIGQESKVAESYQLSDGPHF